MQTARFAITGSGEDADIRAAQVVAALGGIAVPVAEAMRPLYHAALCHASNHLVTLLDGAFGALAAAGVEAPAALVAPLVRAALENTLAHGFDALSGPLLRGDTATIAGHAQALGRDCPGLVPAYRAMASATLDRLEQTGVPHADALRQALRQGLP